MKKNTHIWVKLGSCMVHFQLTTYTHHRRRCSNISCFIIRVHKWNERRDFWRDESIIDLIFIKFVLWINHLTHVNKKSFAEHAAGKQIFRFVKTNFPQFFSFFLLAKLLYREVQEECFFAFLIFLKKKICSRCGIDGKKIYEQL